MHELLPKLSNIRVTQLTGKVTAKSVANIDQLVVVLPTRPRPEHWRAIPQGARLMGRYQSEVSYGQNRALVIWERLIFPDGSSILISEPGADEQGYAGLSDRTDHHWDRVFLAAGLATVLGIGSEIGNDSDGDIERAIRRGVSDTVNQAGQRVVDRTLGIQPTIRVRPGWPVRVIVTRDLVLRPAKRS